MIAINEQREFVLLVSAFSLLLAVARSSAIDFTRTEIPGTGVTLNLPTDWVPIPSEVIHRYKDAAASSCANPTETRRPISYVCAAHQTGPRRRCAAARSPVRLAVDEISGPICQH
jgi:hypothetical protein